MCTVLLSPGVNQIAVKYIIPYRIISCIISYHISYIVLYISVPLNFDENLFTVQVRHFSLSTLPFFQYQRVKAFFYSNLAALRRSLAFWTVQRLRRFVLLQEQRVDIDG